MTLMRIDYGFCVFIEHYGGKGHALSLASSHARGLCTVYDAKSGRLYTLDLAEDEDPSPDEMKED